MAKTVLGIFQNEHDATNTITMLKDHGYRTEDISVVMRDTNVGDNLPGDTGADVITATASGAGTGAVAGGLAGLVASYMIPGLGAFFIGGPIAAALGLTGAAAATASGAATGGVVGGLMGALSGWGLSEAETKSFQKEIEKGSILVAVPIDQNDDQNVQRVMSQCNAKEVRAFG
ncbi:hypothetical protein HGA91_05860 [candidate division WWE3 bacterium]|nr:hypothetical protein [candidate division WWE3 bacterium]